MKPLIGTQSGRLLSVTEPDLEAIYIHDISHGLAHLCRWTGQVRFFYSVAEHCLHVEQQAPPTATPMERLQALMHDAPEAYLGDVSHPVKIFLPGYRTLETIWWEAIATAFDMPFELPDWVREADRAVALAEADAFMPAEVRAMAYKAYPESQPADLVYKPGKTGPGFFAAWAPYDARMFWIARWRELFADITAQDSAMGAPA